MKKSVHNIKRFTYGHQFECEKASLREYIALIVKHAPSRKHLEEAIRKAFFSGHSSKTKSAITEDNQRKLAMNCYLSLRAYQLLERVATDPEETYKPSNLALHLAKISDDVELYREFARHILLNLSGTDLLKAIESVSERGEEPTLQRVIRELNEIGYELSPNAIYPSTMRQWLSKAGLFESPYKIAWDVFQDLTGVDQEMMKELYRLAPEQKYFLLSLIELNPRSSIPWPDVVRHASTTKRLDYDLKTFPKTVLAPLIEAGFVEMDKTTEGRGAKPNLVRLTKVGKQKFLAPFVANLASLVSLDSSELNKNIETILEEIDSSDKHVKGKALELLAIAVIRICALRFIQWRKRDNETGSGEVDVIAASDTFIYNRWQIQCKNTKTVDTDTVAKEVGMMFLTRADVVMLITTGSFTRDARSYADAICSRSRYYVILIDGEHLRLIKEDKTNIVPILNSIAKRTFVRKEYGLTAEQADAVADESEQSEQDSQLSIQLDS